MKTADKSFSSKAMKVLLSIALVIGLAPAISPAKAYAAGTATGITVGGTAVNDDTTTGTGYTWDNTAEVLTITGPITGQVSLADTNTVAKLIIKVAASAQGSASIIVEDKAAIENLSADPLTIDATAGALSVKTISKSSTATQVPAISSTGAGTLTFAGNAKGALAQTTVSSALASGTTPAAVSVAGELTVDANAKVITANATTTGANAVEVNGEVTGDIVSGGATTINGTVGGDVLSADAIIIASTADSVVGGNVSASAAAKDLTVGDQTNDGSFAATIGSIGNATTALGAVVIGGSKAVENPKATTVSEGIFNVNATTTIRETAVVSGPIAVLDGKTLVVEAGADVKGATISLGTGSLVANTTNAAIHVTKTDDPSKTLDIPANTTAGFISFSIGFKDSISTFDYTGADLNALDALRDKIEIFDATGASETPTWGPAVGNYKFEIFAADGITAATPTEAGSYVAKISKYDGTNWSESQTITFTINKGKYANIVVTADDVTHDGIPQTPAATVTYVSAWKADGTVETANIVNPANYTLGYTNNVAVGEATVTATFGADSSITAGSAKGTFKIINANPDEYLPNAKVAYTNGAGSSTTDPWALAAASVSIDDAWLKARVSSIKVGATTYAETAGAGVTAYGTNFTFALTSDKAGKAPVTALTSAGTYYIKITDGAETTTFTGEKIVPFVVIDQNSLKTGYEAAFAPLSDAVFTGASSGNAATQPARTTLTLTNTTKPTDKIVFAADQYTITKTDVTVANVTAATKAKITEVTIDDVTSPYNGTVVKIALAAGDASSSFGVKALDLSDPTLNLKVVARFANPEVIADKAISAPYKGSDYTLTAAAKATEHVDAAGTSTKATEANILADVNGGTFAIDALVASTIVDNSKDAGSYGLKLERMSSDGAVTKTATIDKAVTITPFDLSNKAADTVTYAANETLTYTGKAQLPKDITAEKFGTGKVAFAKGDVSWMIYAKNGSTVSETASDAINAGNYRSFLKAESPNFTGTASKPNDFAIGQVNFSTVNVAEEGAYYVNPADSSIVKPEFTVTLGTGVDAINVPATSYTADWTAVKPGIGSKQVTLTAKTADKNFAASSNTKAVNYNVTTAGDLKSASYSFEPYDYTYTVKNGKAVEQNAPKLIIKTADGKKTFTQGVDFKLAATGTTASAAGDHALTGITVSDFGDASYKMPTAAELENLIPAWTIKTADLSGATVEPIADQKAKGSAVTVTPVITFNGMKLTSDTEYATALNYYSVDAAGAKTKVANAIDAGTYYVEAVAKASTNFTEGSTVGTTFKIVKTDISNAAFKLNNAKALSQEYSGAAFAPTVSTTQFTINGDTVVLKNNPFDVLYYTDAACLKAVVDANGDAVAPTEIGTYYVIAKTLDSDGVYTGKTSVDTACKLTITKKAAASIAATNAAIKYNGEARTLALTADGIAMEEGVDYKVSYTHEVLGKDVPVATPTNKDTYKATITALAGGHFTFVPKTNLTLTIAALPVTKDAASANNGQLVSDPIPTQKYTGLALKPVPTNVGVKVQLDDGSFKVMPLSAGVDYSIASYASNTAAGTASMTLAFPASITNITADANTTLSFDIAKANSLKFATVAPIEDQVYTGSAVEPKVVVTLDGKILVENTDYKVMYHNNTRPGAAWAEITAVDLGAYIDSTEANFNIIEKTTYKTLAGDTALETMMKIQKDAFAANSCDTVIVATAASYYDALAASGLAGAIKAKSGKDVPVLITDKGALSAETAATIAYVGASHVIIAGGEAGVPAEVAASLKALPGITDVKRVAGDTAVDTAIKANAEAASAGNVSDTAILATSAYFADALSVAPYAYAKGAPIYLASADGSMTPETAAALANYKNIKIVGGTASVSKDTEAALKATASVERWAGDDAYQTSADIASKAVASGVLSFGKTSVATGKSYYDALCASAAAGSKKSAVLLVDEGEAASYGITNVITTNKADIKAVDFLGGNASVTPATKSAIQAILG